jgi:rod shape-determining protein MreD
LAGAGDRRCHRRPDKIQTPFTDEPLRWLPYFIFAYLMLGIQLGLGSFTAFRGVPPNLPLILVIFFSLNAPHNRAVLASVILGATQDLISLQPLGLFAFSYGLVSLLVCWLAESVRRSHPLTHLSLTFMGTMVVGMILLIHDLIRPMPVPAHGGVTASPVRVGPRVVVVFAVYTTLLSPLVIFLLQQGNRAFPLDPGNRRRARV